MQKALNNNSGQGFHRRIRLFPLQGRIVAGLEDNLHFFAMQLVHANGEIIGMDIRAERYPWTTCPGAVGFLNDQAVGKKLSELAQLNMFQHCTHLFELAVLSAAHAADRQPVQFDLHVDDWVDGKTRVGLWIDDQPVLTLAVNGRIIETPGEWYGRDLFQSSQWQHELDAAGRKTFMLMARAIYVSLGRAAPVVERAAERGSSTIGVCYSYQLSRVEDAVRVSHSRREFSEAFGQPLKDFDPKRFFMAR